MAKIFSAIGICLMNNDAALWFCEVCFFFGCGSLKQPERSAVILRPGLHDDADKINQAITDRLR